MKITARKAKAPSSGKVRLELLNEMRSISKDMLDDMKEPVADWKTPPKFDVKLSLAGGEPSVSVTTTDDIYRYLDEGTEAHWIEPVNASVLAFPLPSGEMAFSMGHEVSGIKPRKYSEKVQKKWRGEFGKRMKEAMKRAAEATGQSKG